MDVNEPDDLTAADREQLRAHGVSEAEARTQLERLRRPPAFAGLDRPCTLGDGLVAVEDDAAGDIIARGGAAALAGRCTKFVPASGAATRMFRDLSRFHAGPGALTEARLRAAEAAGDEAAPEARAFLQNLREFAFAADLREAVARAGGSVEALAREGRYDAILDALLSPERLGYSRRPKALLPFHRYPGGSRTAFEEHLVEAADLVRDRAGVCRVHFTVSPEHLAAFRRLLAAVGPPLQRRLQVRFEASFSVQAPSTDTLAVDPDGRPFRAADGKLLLRAAGHGALLQNLGELGADLVLIKNVDNIAPDRLKEPTRRWGLVLIGMLVGLQERIFALLHRLEDAADRAAIADAAAFCRDVLGAEAPDRTGRGARSRLVRALHRPTRVCGMVPNEGEPGGGPFWVRDGDLISRQIVESAQVDPASASQRARFAAGTHFNPVFLACGLRDHAGRCFDLARYVDARTVLVTRKSAGGHELTALERPGLWNGAMAGWHTVFVQVPPDVFNPVKTVTDLLRPAHRGFAEAPDPG